VARYRPADGESDFLADGLDQLYGVAVGPGGIVAVEQGTGRLLSVDAGRTEVLASGLNTPVGVAFGPDGSPLVSERGRVVRVDGGSIEPLVDGLASPQGILVSGNLLYVVDADTKSLIEVDLAGGTRATIASGLPVGAPPGVTPKPLRGMPPFSGPQGPFAGIAAAADGTLYVSADTDGSVLAVRRKD
jgi:sugar lactone lactonase YvrE